MLPSLSYAYRALDDKGNVIQRTGDYSSGDGFSHYFQGDSITYSGYKHDTDSSLIQQWLQFYFPCYEIIPDIAIDTSAGGQYNINTRPTTITGGNVGIIGDDGQLTIINDNRQIINEGDNIYYNPATGETRPIIDWTYDYGDRIYNVTVEGGDTYTVTYGDENITIVENTVNEGDTIVNNYTIYYIMDGEGGGENPGPSPSPGPEVTVCPHIWKELNRTEPACTSPGKAQYICTQCGETKLETLKATGHTWQVLRTVQTAYDDEGNMTQQGYTIYQCSVCSEQYKDDQGTGPPGGPGDKDDDKETIWDKIANFFGSIVDGIAGIFEAILLHRPAVRPRGRPAPAGDKLCDRLRQALAVPKAQILRRLGLGERLQHPAHRPLLPPLLVREGQRLQRL